MNEDYLFAWEGAASPHGPWKQLRVKTFRGTEGLGEVYSYEVDLVCPRSSGELDLGEMLGAWGTLAIRTAATPPIRLVHGIIAALEDMGDAEEGLRVRVTLAPPIARASMMKKSVIHLDKTLSEILSATLERTSRGAALGRSTDMDRGVDVLDSAVYRAPRATYGWGISRSPRLSDRRARPYCVQYDEDDWSFVCRLLEEEGIAFHFEHTAEECVLMLTDNDDARVRMPENDPLGPEIAAREVVRWHAGARLRPRSVVVDDFDMRKPDLDLLAPSPSGIGPFTTMEFPGRYGAARELGAQLALVREERFDTERTYATAETFCRFLQAGSIFWLSHPSQKVSGHYLVTRIVMEGRLLVDFAEAAAEPYKARIEVLRCGAPNEPLDSHYRPAQRTARPRIHGTQTAIVTADPTANGEEIWVGGDENLGSVRLHFHWDEDAGRLAVEPSSCWIRVSQIFAGASHGAMWHPRVGDEVVVDFLDGDPDRPIVVGRVFNGKNLPPENATQHPTWSCLKSYSLPANGNYNMLAFEDRQGKEEIRIHAARDFILESLHDNVRYCGNNDRVHVKGDQKYVVDGTQMVQIGRDQTTAYLADETHSVVGSRITGIKGSDELHSDTSITLDAPLVEITGQALLTMEGSTTVLTGQVVLTMQGAAVRIQGNSVVVQGSAISVVGKQVNVDGEAVNVRASGDANVTAGGAVNVTGAVVNLNC